MLHNVSLAVCENKFLHRPRSVLGGKTNGSLIEEPSVTYGFALVPRDRRKMSRHKAVVSWEFILADGQM
jgi:hypothetical protein